MRDQLLLERARGVRRQPTPLEHKLWLALRARHFDGAKFRRQVVIGRYIVDFACRIPRMLVVEVDGDSHGATKAYDDRRDAELTRRGYAVVRFTNSEVGSNLEGVMLAIREKLRLPLSPALSPEGEREQ